MIESPVELVDQDGSERGERHFLLYNPPVVDEALGLRKSSLLESVRLAQDLLAADIQSVVFARSRRSVEIILTYLQESREPKPGDQRTEGGDIARQVWTILSSLIPTLLFAATAAVIFPPSAARSNKACAMAQSTWSSLRMPLSLALISADWARRCSWAIPAPSPASISRPAAPDAVRPCAGRAGRLGQPARSVPGSSPRFLLGKSPEQALVNPDHLLILLNHLRCAMFELPFQKGEGFGALPAETVEEYLEFLASNQEAHLSQDKFYWMSDSYPAANISLRSASPESVILHTDEDGRPRTVGEVDLASSYWMVHPGAVYLHEGQQYFVQDLNLQNKTAYLIPVALDYYTEPQRETEIQVLSESASAGVSGGEKGWGEIQVTTQVVGFKKLRWFTQENLGEAPLDLPPTELQTTGYWLSLSNAAVETLRAAGAWTNDPNDYGPDWPRIRLAVRTRDEFLCRVCGAPENGREHDVHHKIPFRAFSSIAEANRMDNLITLCPSCHRKTEQNVRIRSGLAGLSYVLSQLAPLFLMCDPGDLGVHTDPAGTVRGGHRLSSFTTRFLLALASARSCSRYTPNL